MKKRRCTLANMAPNHNRIIDIRYLGLKLSSIVIEREVRDCIGMLRSSKSGGVRRTCLPFLLGACFWVVPSRYGYCACHKKATPRGQARLQLSILTLPQLAFILMRHCLFSLDAALIMGKLSHLIMKA